jgi:hypothetical protein
LCKNHQCKQERRGVLPLKSVTQEQNGETEVMKVNSPEMKENESACERAQENWENDPRQGRAWTSYPTAKNKKFCTDLLQRSKVTYEEKLWLALDFSNRQCSDKVCREKV